MRLKEPYGRAKKDTGNKSTTNLLSWTLTMSMDTAENVQSRFEIVPKSTRVNISSCAFKSMACWKNTRMDQPCPHGGGAGLWTKKAKATSWWLFYLDVIKFSLKWRWNKDNEKMANLLRRLPGAGLLSEAWHATQLGKKNFTKFVNLCLQSSYTMQNSF